MTGSSPTVAIVDHNLGNLFSVKNACARVGLHAVITSDSATIESAAAVILPGVGAFADAMDALRRLDLISVLHDIAQSQTPLFGVCLGVQLLMTESHEFGTHKGLGIIEGEVLPLGSMIPQGIGAKIPHIGWNRVKQTASWNDSPLEDVRDGDTMYFVHSYYVKPADPGIVLASTEYAGFEFCSVVRTGSIFACQFHPERSGERGIGIYRSLARSLKSDLQAESTIQ
jgi:glutamine amidotransferase